jgi:membrane-bound ClpP family serine protease
MGSRMELKLLIGCIIFSIVAVTFLVLALWRHKQAGAGKISLIGERGLVETKLEPEGTVIVAGELWRARSNDGGSIGVGTRVCVIRMQGHLVVVELLAPPI